MVGGGRGAFIGAVHRMAAALDGEIELVCGAFSSNPEKSKASGKDLYLPDDQTTFTELRDKLGSRNFEHVGFVGGNEKKAFFENADCLCFPTKYEAESFGLVAAEAWLIIYGLWFMVYGLWFMFHVLLVYGL